MFSRVLVHFGLALLSAYTPVLIFLYNTCSHVHVQMYMYVHLYVHVRRYLVHLYTAIRCEGCSMKPIEGPRFHCQVCADFDFCQECFIRGQAHDHAFERVDDQGQPAVYVGSPKTCRIAMKHKKKVCDTVIHFKGFF